MILNFGWLSFVQGQTVHHPDDTWAAHFIHERSNFLSILRESDL